MHHNRRRGDGLEAALAALVLRIGPCLQDSSVARSILERHLVGVGASTALRAAVMQALEDARIQVIDDVSPGERPPDAQEVTDRGPGPDRAASSLTDSVRCDLRSSGDPLDAGRRRLAKDRSISPTGIPKVLLRAEEEVSLALLARPDGEPLEAGGLVALEGEGQAAAEALVLHNLGLAHSVSRGYVGQGLEYDDLFQSSVLGLLRAVELFDPAAGFKFSTYATWWLRQAVTRAIANEGRVVRIPVHMHELIRKVSAVRERLTVDGKPPKRHDLADACGLTLDKLIECLILMPGAISLDMPLGDDGFTLGDAVDAQVDVPEHIEVHGLFPEDIEPLLQRLKPREAEVIRMRYGLAPYDVRHTLDDIGKVYGVTRERVRQIESRAFTGLRLSLTQEGHVIDASDASRKRERVRSSITMPDEQQLPATA